MRRKSIEWTIGILTIAILCGLALSGPAVADNPELSGVQPAQTPTEGGDLYFPLLLNAPVPTATPTNTSTPTSTPTATNTPTATPTNTATATTAAVASDSWRGEYFANTDLSGDPVLVRSDAKIDFVWGASGPGIGLPVDGFSARWTREALFTAGEYVFKAQTDDGVRLWVDGNLLIDQWQNQGPATREGTIYLDSGPHKVQVEYYEDVNYAAAKVWWEASSNALNWRGEYYENAHLLGTPVAVRQDPIIEFDWQGDAPMPELPQDGFSVRWTKNQFFVRGIYRFHTKTDDGVRLWVDGQLLIDKWEMQDNVEWIVDVPLETGLHFIKMEYYDDVGIAKAKFWWGRADYFPHWKAEYFANTTLSGAPVVTRDDTSVNFNWGFGAPAANVPADNFSVRWTRNQVFPAGTYRFYTNTSDGVRLWVDNVLLIDQWHDQEATTYSQTIYLAEGQHAIHMEYYERFGNAVAMLWWEEETAAVGWRGEYFPNSNLEGSPAFVRTDEAINFDWSDSAPNAALDPNDFSVRWTRDYEFPYSGAYTFRATTDDGVRVWIDNVLIIDQWVARAATTNQTTRFVSRGTHRIRVEYFEAGDLAVARFRWYGGPGTDAVLIDAGDPGFDWGGNPATWNEVTAGYNGHMYWTENSTPFASHWATWRPPLPRAGFYEVYAFVPGPLSSARGVRYYMFYDGETWTVKPVDQSLYAEQWVSLGILRYKADGNEFVYLTNRTDQPAGSEQVAFDAMRWVYRGP